MLLMFSKSSRKARTKSALEVSAFVGYGNNLMFLGFISKVILVKNPSEHALLLVLNLRKSSFEKNLRKL